MADVGEVENHRQPEELASPLIDSGTATGDNDLGEVVFQGNLRVTKSHGGITVDNERW